MEQLILKPLNHKGEENIAMYFSNVGVMNSVARKIKTARWTKTHRCWYVPLSKENHTQITNAFKDIASIEQSALRQYLVEKKKIRSKAEAEKLHGKPTPVSVASNAPSKPTPARRPLAGKRIEILYKGLRIDAVNSDVLPSMEQQLKLKGYSPSTIRTYLNEMAVFLRTIQQHKASEFTIPRIKDYLQYCLGSKGLSENTVHSRMNALKFYYEQVLGKEKFFFEIPRPKKHQLLPRVLSKEETIRLLKAIENVKHKTMIMLGYACGLRVSEITSLELKDVDGDRRLLFIRRGKGKKDRLVSLSPVMLIMLREYARKYKPVKYLFEGQVPGSAYSVRSLESIIKAAKQKAGIIKSGSMHMLRHSFATHLLEKGTDVVLIQKLLGHSNIKTTLQYLHVTNKDMINILSPIEDIKDFL